METALDDAAPAPSRTGGRVLVYDGDCPLCTRSTGWLVRLGVLAPADRRAFAELDAADAGRVLAAGMRDELVALDPGTGAVRPGLDGLAWALERTHLGPLARLARSAPLARPLAAAYRFVAANRRYLSTPPPSAVPCACEPTQRAGYQAGLAGACALLAAGVLLLLGAVAPPELRLVGSRLGVLGPLVKAGWPWALPVLLAGTLERPQRLPYLTHLAVTAAAGALVLAPLALAGLLAPRTVALAFETLLQLGCVGAGLLTFALQRRRVAYQGLSASWLYGWAACAAFGLVTLGWLRTLG